MSDAEGTPLADVPGWKKSYVDKLQASWITTAEQVVGAAATPGGRQLLARQVGVAEEEMDRLIDRARAALPPEVAAQLAHPVDTRGMGLGALPPPRQPRQPRQ